MCVRNVTTFAAMDGVDRTILSGVGIEKYGVQKNVRNIKFHGIQG